MLSFKKEDINDWECWLQLEFYYFLSQEKNVAEIYRECTYPVRKNSVILSDSARVDFAIRKKGASKEVYLIIEFKVDKDRGKCLQGMVDDSVKIKALKKAPFDGRSVFYIGFFYDRAQFRNKEHEKWATGFIKMKEYPLKIKHFAKIGRSGVNIIILE